MGFEPTLVTLEEAYSLNLEGILRLYRRLGRKPHGSTVWDECRRLKREIVANIAYRGLGKILGCQGPLSKLGVAVALPGSFLDEATSVIDKLLKEKETSKSSAGDG